MAYMNGDTRDGYRPATGYSRYKDPDQDEYDLFFDAQVASQQAIYNAQVEESLERERKGLPPVWKKPISLPVTKALPVATVDQRSFSVDQGSNHKISTVHTDLSLAQQDAFAKLTGGLNKSHQQLQSMIEEETSRRQNIQGREIEDNNQDNQFEMNRIRLLQSQERPSTARSIGLPSNPRPDPHRRMPSSARSLSRDHTPAPAEVAYTSDLAFQNPSSQHGSRTNSPAVRPPPSFYGPSHERKPSAVRYESPDPWSRELSDYQVPGHERKTSVEGRHGRPAQRTRQASHDRQLPAHERKDSSMTRGRQASQDNYSAAYARKESIPTNDSRRPLNFQQNTFDAPRSAVNAGARKVKVMCEQVSLTLTFMPNTTVADLLVMARDRLGEGFDMARYILVEAVKEIGLERPLRHYERVRDVLNSWDTDEQNYLLIQPYHAHWEHESLDLHHAPKILPSSISTTMYYSHRPESWHKWIFTLRVDGQIVMQKYKDGDNKKVCHMSDFDIYVPTSKQMKKLAPPRKFCFAIKSLQKSAAFQDTSNFVHFFSASDKDVAAEWYRAVHGWRSYYMVHQMGLGEQPPPRSGKPSISAASAQRNGSIASRKMSEDKPLPPLVDTPVTSTFQKPVHERGGASPYARNAASSSDRSGSVDRGIRNMSLDQGNDPFVQGGLLGKSYAVRKDSTTGVPEPFGAGTLLGDSYTARKESLAAESDPFAAVGLLGNGYAAHKGSYTTELQEAPFAAGGLLGKAYTQRKESSASNKPLAHPYAYGRPSIDHGSVMNEANQPAASVPPPTEWKFDPVTGKPLSRKHGDSVSSKAPTAYSSEDDRGRARTADRKFSNTDTPFAAGSLLAQAPSSQSAAQGRGMRKASGDRNGPLLDMSETSQFPAGSLLYKVEQQQNGKGPTIQRERVHEITTRTGEQFF